MMAAVPAAGVEAPYPISLDRLMFTRSIVVAVVNHEPSPEPLLLEPTNNLGINRMEDREHAFMAIMTCKVNTEQNPRHPYLIDMECVAIFHTDGSLSPEEELRGVTINANSVCYGAIREAVAWLTSRQPYGSVMLGMSVLRSMPTTAAAAPKA